MLELINLIKENNCKKVAEIGIFKGRTMRKVLRNRETFNTIEEYWAIDPFTVLTHYKSYKEKGFHRLGKFTDEQWKWAYNKVLSYMAWFPQLKVVKLTSEEAAKLFPNHYFPKGYFDLIFIDGDHTYEAVKQDIQLWQPLLIPEGILCGHDYSERHYPGVKRAVDEIFGEENIKLLGNNIWVKK